MSDSAPRFIKPGWLTNRVLNPVMGWLARRGLGFKGAAVLEVVGRGALITRAGREEFAVAEVDDSAKVPIIRAYLKEWAWEVGAFFENLSATSSDAEVLAAAPGFPVFRIIRD